MNENEKKRLEELEELEKKVKARNKYLNDFQKSRYDRLVLLLPKGDKQKVENAAKNRGFRTTTDYIKSLIETDLNNPGN